MPKHLKPEGESYVQHARFALSVAAAMLIAALALTIHAIVPCMFPTHGSQAIDRLNNTMRERRLKIGFSG